MLGFRTAARAARAASRPGQSQWAAALPQQFRRGMSEDRSRSSLFDEIKRVVDERDAEEQKRNGVEDAPKDPEDVSEMNAEDKKVHSKAKKNAFSAAMRFQQVMNPEVEEEEENTLRHRFQGEYRPRYERLSERIPYKWDPLVSEDDPENIFFSDLARSVKTYPRLKPPSLAARLSRDEFKEIYTTKSLTAEHSEEDLGKYFLIPEDVKVPAPALARCMADEMKNTGDYMMVREHALGLTQQLAKYGTEQQDEVLGQVVGLYGYNGTGKSSTMHYVAQYAKQNDWLLISTQGKELGTDLLGFIKPSKVGTGRHPRGWPVYDQPRFAAAWFAQFVEQQPELLEKIPVQARLKWFVIRDKKIELEQRIEEARARGQELNEEVDVNEPGLAESDTRDHTMLELAQVGAGDDLLAAEIMYDFVEELRTQTAVPVLVQFDDLNLLDHLTDMMRHDQPTMRLDRRQLSVVDALSVFESEAPKNGVSMFSITDKGTLKRGQLYLDRANQKAELRPYTDPQIIAATKHYNASGYNIAELSDRLYKRVKGMTGGVPSECFMYATIT